ncbi:MAG: hypothetical protein R3Y67_04650 [Eubacteriales bacterium]
MDTIWLVIQLYNDYFGRQGYLVWLFAACLVYLWITEREKTRRFYLVFFSTAIVVLFLCPLVAYIAVRTIFDQETYYRILWLLPTYPVIAYTITKVITERKRMGIKVLLACASVAIIAGSGVYVYGNTWFVKSENIYHLPQVTVDICDKINEEGEWVYAVVPKELIESVRQYSENLRLPYGREMLIERWGFSHSLYDIMEADVIVAEELASEARLYNCHYIVLAEYKEMDGRLEDYDYELFARVEHYTIYLDGTLEEAEQ